MLVSLYSLWSKRGGFAVQVSFQSVTIVRQMAPLPSGHGAAVENDLS